MLVLCKTSPNPAIDKVTLSGFVAEDGQAIASIYNVTGMLVKRVKMPENSIEIHEFQVGSYLLKVVASDGAVFIGRFVCVER